jgi:glucose/arabinose dehydrogenase
MNRTTLAVFLAAVTANSPAAAEPPLVQGLKNPAAVAAGPDRRAYVTAAGGVFVVADGKAVPFATGLDDPKGIVAWKDVLFVADRNRVVRIDKAGKVTPYVEASAFPEPPAALTGLTADERGGLYVIDIGNGNGGWAVYSVSPPGRSKPKVALVADSKQFPDLKKPSAVAMGGGGDPAAGTFHLLLLDAGTGELHSLRLADKALTRVGGFGSRGGLAWDWYGRLYVSDAEGGRVFVVPRPSDKPVQLAAGFKAPGGLGLAPDGKSILVTDAAAGTLTALPAQVPGAPVDEAPLPAEFVPAFPELQWTGWAPETAAGRPQPLRPILLTHAGDGSNRVFVPTQQGVIHVFPNDPKAAKTKVFLDLQHKAKYNDNTNEEGFLGLAFHPDYKRTGQFFVFYTDKNAKLTNVVSRFRVSKDDPDRADPASEEELLRIQKPFWNHDGGTICFGPDGYLYITHGDGGLGNDPYGNGQNLNTLLGKVLRIDVNKSENGKPYAIPPDNPFVGRQDARPEVFAYGVRNLWRMAFDRKTGKLWAGEVGQNLYEEVNVIEKGGNYGWSLRESLHPFGAKGVGPRPGLTEPLWEYHHDLGKSITGGLVYRGAKVPELAGLYLYADYVAGWVKALRYDEAQKRVVDNHPVRAPGLPWMSFGEDERGEAYLMTYSASGQGVYRVERAKPAGAAAVGQ